MISRVLGFVRDMIFARLFGAGMTTDAFFVAFKIPNFLRRLFAEGAFSQAFVPVLSEYKETGSRENLKGFIDKTAGSLALTLIVVTVVGVLVAPLLVMMFAPGFLGQTDQFEMTVEMLRITFPYLFFISSTAFAGGILNTFQRFAIPAVTPAILNLCLISAAIWLAPHMSNPIIALAWGVFIAGMAQLMFQFPALMRLGLLPRLRFGFGDAGVRKILRLMVPAIVGVSVTQINLLVDTLIASFLAAGSVTWLYYSDRLVEFPLGVFGIALATVILPNLSKNHVANKPREFSQSLDWGLRWVLVIGSPAAIGLLLLAEPILSTLFQYDEFSHNDVLMASKSLMAYAGGLLAFILVKVLVPAYTSRQDMRTPVRYGIVAMLANIVLNIILVFQFAHAGLALATSIASFINAGLLLKHLLREKVYIPAKGWLVFVCRIVIANLAMMFVLIMAVDVSLWQSWSAFDRSWYLMLWVGCGMLVYCAILWISGMRFSHLTTQNMRL